MKSDCGEADTAWRRGGVENEWHTQSTKEVN